MPSAKLDTNGKLTLANVIVAIGTTAVLGWLTWTVRSIVKLQPDTPRYSHDMAQADHSAIRLELREWVRREYPPAALLKRIERLEERCDDQ